MEDLVTIKRSDLESLTRSSLIESASDAAGIDNWEGWEFVELPTDEDVESSMKSYIVTEEK